VIARRLLKDLRFIYSFSFVVSSFVHCSSAAIGDGRVRTRISCAKESAVIHTAFADESNLFFLLVSNLKTPFCVVTNLCADLCLSELRASIVVELGLRVPQLGNVGSELTLRSSARNFGDTKEILNVHARRPARLGRLARRFSWTAYKRSPYSAKNGADSVLDERLVACSNQLARRCVQV
jgi:hypothetical protein